MPRRVFMGWERPALESAAEFLLALAEPDAPIDLERFVIVLPGGRAARLLLAALLERTDRPLVPPTLITPGSILAELGPPPTAPTAGPASRRLAWTESLRQLPNPARSDLLPHAPDHNDLPGWAALADAVAATHDELTRHLLTFDAVASSDALPPEETDRWCALAAAEADYARRLSELDLADPDLDLARAQPAPTTDRPVVLVAVPELAPASRVQLPDDTTALVFAPDTLADHFDDLGCAIPDAWSDAPIGLDDEQIVFTASPTDQAEQALAAIARLGAEFSPEEIVIGVPDPAVIPRLEHTADKLEAVSIRAAPGTPLARTGPILFLRAAGAFLDDHFFDSLATLLRHPDVERALAGDGPEDQLARLDRYGQDHLPTRITKHWLGKPSRYAPLARAHERLLDLLEPLRHGHIHERFPIADWTDRVADTLAGVYPTLDRAHDRAALAALDAIGTVLDELRAHATPATVGEALTLIADLASTGSVSPAPDPDAVEALGWLDLHLDPAPVAIVTGMNEGVIPAALHADAFVPEPLRRALDLPRDETRLARDAYLLSALGASKQHLTLIAGSRSADGDPLKPSRLLLRADPATLARRLRRFLADEPPALAPLRVVPRVAGTPRFRPRPVPELASLDSISVTDFAVYLESPYRYLLERRLGLEQFGRPDAELDAANFGSLIHNAIEAFGRSDARDSTDAAEILAFLEGAIDAYVHERFGRYHAPGVAIQGEVAKLRLADFAKWQRDRRAQGWRIEHTEWRPTTPVTLVVDGLPVRLRGKIDRVEEHTTTGQLALLDFKTGNVDEPGKSHRRRDGTWRDLQLPLYRHVAAELGAGDDTLLAYVAVPKTKNAVELLPAEWSPDDLASADECAHSVVRDIRAGLFDDTGRWSERDPSTLGALAGFYYVGVEDES